MVGGGVLEWGSHCVDLCQWAADADDTVPVEYAPGEGIVNAMSDNVTMIGADESLPEAAARMREAYIHHLVVVDDEQMVGVLSTFDLLGEIAETT